MSNITLRAIHISNGIPGLHVMFSWFDKSRPAGEQYQCLTVEERNSEVGKELRDQLNKMGVRWHITELSENRFGIIGDFPQALEGLFDLAISDPDPMIALTTPYEFVIQPHNEAEHVQ